MAKASREFQVFAKPAGAVCNLACSYCYYLKKKDLYSAHESFRMDDSILEEYIKQHIKTSPNPEITFSWHGGEPTVLGLDYFKKITKIQKKHMRPGYRITNGIQTNGTLMDDEWARFFADEGFAVGLSLDGPPNLHDKNRLTKTGNPTHKQVIQGYELLRRHQVYCDILCVVNADNVRHPSEVYGFFKDIEARYISFLPLVVQHPDVPGGVSRLTPPAEDWGDFLCRVFDIWKEHDIGRIKVQIIEETAQKALGRDHALCILRETCGDIPVIEHNGDFYSCDHYVDPEHCLGNIMDTPLVYLFESPAQREFGLKKRDSLPQYCRACNVIEMCNGECPKNRFIITPDGEPGLNYLCAGYKRFFKHCHPFVNELSALRKSAPTPQMSQNDRTIKRSKFKTGRNDPCPCDSGRKYKKCCLGK